MVAYNVVMDAVEEIKARLAIEDVIGEYVELKRAGRNFKGLSPFSNERTPSFMVSPEKQIWHDFSSGRGGNMFSFVMEMEGLDFKGALELLARKAGVDLSQYQSGRSAETGQLKEKLFRVNELAAKFYQVQFSRKKPALEYILKKRRFTKAVALEFRLGYSPNNGTALFDYLKKQGIEEQIMQKAGLITKRFGRPSDMFRGRIMVPLMDQQGGVVGFTARLLDDDPNAPKYINTPQTLLYDKSRHIFGLNLAKEAIRRQGYVVVSEGNLDVIASHQAGIKHVVATAGTAMTESHLKTLARFTPDIRLAFDQDQAGQAAVERTIPIASKLNISLSIITIPEGKDPDDLIRKDPERWQQVIEDKQYAVDWLISRYKETMDLDSADGKRRFSDTILATVRQLNDAVEQDHYLQQLAELLSVSADALRAKLQINPAASRILKRPKSPIDQPDPRQTEYIKLQDHLLCLCLYRPSLRSYLEKLDEGMLVSKDAKMLLTFMRDFPDFDGAFNHLGGNAKRRLQQIADYVKIIRLQYETLYQELDELELQYEAARLQTRLIEHYVKTKKVAIANELRDANDTRTKELLEAARALDLLLKG